MQAYNEFKNMGADFWALIKFISELLGYTFRNSGEVRVYSVGEIERLCHSRNTFCNDGLIKKAAQYSEMRANTLNNIVRTNLMDATAASAEFQNLYAIHQHEHFLCEIPLNKQKGDMRQIAYFTAIINILTEKTIRNSTGRVQELGFDDSPGGLSYIWNNNKELVGASSRRFDGAYPSIYNPRIVWEIKEYYYATTFGSRVADAVFETQLDGYEFQELYDRTGQKVQHILFIDAYGTWWTLGKSYLCRIMDILNSGLVDEVIVGREVLTRWPELLRQLL